MKVKAILLRIRISSRSFNITIGGIKYINRTIKRAASMSDYPQAILALRYLGKVLTGSRSENERPLMGVRRDALYVNVRIKCSTSARCQGDIICLSHYYE
jgi:hypothetical protein